MKYLETLIGQEKTPGNCRFQQRVTCGAL